MHAWEVPPRIYLGSPGWFEPLAAVQIFPPDFDVLPPHCLKKKATRSRSHWSRIPRIHSAETGRWPGPLSPPTITQSIAFNGRRGKSCSKGSTDKKRTLAGTFRRQSARHKYSGLSTDTPCQMLFQISSRDCSAPFWLSFTEPGIFKCKCLEKAWCRLIAASALA